MSELVDPDEDGGIVSISHPIILKHPAYYPLHHSISLITPV